MASDSTEPTRRKHHRSSNEDAGERSKRRKHRHLHHRHRSSKDKEEAIDLEREELKGDRNDEPGFDVTKSNNNGDADIGDKIDALDLAAPEFTGLDYEMEEGEILEDTDLIGGDGSENPQKKLLSDVESGEIETNGYDDLNTGVEENVEGFTKNFKTFRKDSLDCERNTEIDRERLLNSASLANGDYTHKYQKDDVILCERHERRTSDFPNESGLRYSSPEKKHSPESCTDSHDQHTMESSNSNLSKSPEWSRGRSRSRSILRECSMEGHHLVRKLPTESDDGRTTSNTQNNRQSSRVYLREKEWESKSGRYSRTERQYGKEPLDIYRKGNKERDSYTDKLRENEKMDRARERIRGQDRDRGEREREYVKDGTRDMGNERKRDRAREKESGTEKGRGRERERDREKEGRDRGRGVRDGGRSRSRDKGRDNESRHKYDKEKDGVRYKDYDSRRRRNSEDHYRDKSSKGDTESISSKAKHERANKNLEIDEDKQEDYQEKIAMKLAEHEEDEVKRIKEESRRRMQAILEKYKNQQKQNESQPQGKVIDQVGESSVQEAPTEALIPDTDKSKSSMNVYAPDSSFSLGKSPSQNGYSPFQTNPGTGGLGEGSPKSEGLDDMFCDDIFGESPAGVRKAGKGDGAIVDKDGLDDNWDDAEGYYGYRFGEVLDGRYEIIAAHGKGVFSTVVRAKDLKAKLGDPEEVAIKIIRNNETMYKAGMEELVILKKLVGADPEDKRHCVRFLSTFKYRNHLCLVFESLHMNLREVLKKFGRNIGLKLTAVRAYAKQLFIALKHLKNCGVLHCDIKPDNILVNEAKNVLKLCDFGNAMFAGKNEITPYLVSRFYRAPEIILGLPYDHSLDVWSVGCCLFEIYAGKVLFPGPTNNDMLRLHMELKGPFPKKMLRKGAFTDQHFDQDLNFLASEEDPVTKKAIRRLIVNIKPKDFGSLISGSPGEDPKMVANFRDLLEKVFVLDPEKRLSVSQALSHPFITARVQEVVGCGLVEVLKDYLGEGD